jgi:hypothetical protein
MTLSIMTFSIMSLSIKGLLVTLSINDIQHKFNIDRVPLCCAEYRSFLIHMLNVIMLSVASLNVLALF